MVFRRYRFSRFGGAVQKGCREKGEKGVNCWDQSGDPKTARFDDTGGVTGPSVRGGHVMFRRRRPEKDHRRQGGKKKGHHPR